MFYTSSLYLWGVHYSDVFTCVGKMFYDIVTLKCFYIYWFFIHGVQIYVGKKQAGMENNRCKIQD